MSYPNAPKSPPRSRTAPEATPVDIDATLAERGTRYGEYRDHARITQAIKQAMQNGTNYHTKLTDDQRETLDMLAHKLGRILNGDPEFHDSWHDMVGYTRLSADEVLRRAEELK